MCLNYEHLHEAFLTEHIFKDYSQQLFLFFGEKPLWKDIYSRQLPKWYH